MIKVDRLDCPDILKIGLAPISNGQSETADAILFFRDTANEGAKYRKMGKRGDRINESYTAYADKTVRELLNKMFHGKCAYCESRIIAIYNGDIEHFRPKGRYYWLAADWENLLFACPFCNQTHTHVIAKNGSIQEVVQGKLDQFPLLTEAVRLTVRQGDVFLSDVTKYKEAFGREEGQRLLLRPCTDENIERYFKYDDEGLMLVGDGLNSTEQRKAETSINTYALQRLGLVLEREARVIQVKAQLQRVDKAIANLNKAFDGLDEEKVLFENLLITEMKVLRRFKDADQEYAGLARYIIGRYFEKFEKK